MILCAALRLVPKSVEEAALEIIVPCIRHAEGYAIVRDLREDYREYHITEGFVDTKGFFYDRRAAYTEAVRCGQLPVQIIIDKKTKTEKELYSEDLY